MAKLKYLLVLGFFWVQPAFAQCTMAEDENAIARTHGAALVAMVQNCADAGLDFTAPLPSGELPLYQIVALGNQPQAVAIALEAGADPNTQSVWGAPAFVAMLSFTMEKDDPAVLESLRLLGEAGADFSVPDNHGELALSIAAGGGEIETVRLLLDYGADPNGLNTYDRTPLFETVFGRCSPDVGALLIEKGARLDPMPRDQQLRLFDEAEKVCLDADGGRDYIARLKSMVNG